MLPNTQDTVDVRIDTLMSRYKETPEPQLLRQVVDELSPTIRYTLLSLNALGDPLMENQARLFAAQAVRNFDASRGASIKTHVANQLRQMHRYRRKISDPLRVPERSRIAQHSLHRSEQEFIEAKGREPSLLELSDWSTVPVDQIQKIRAIPNSISESRAAGPDPNNPNDLSVSTPDYFEEAMDYVYRDLSPTDQKIFEGMSGFKGVPQVTPLELSQKLGISQSQISRKFASMMSSLQDIDRELNDMNRGI